MKPIFFCIAIVFALFSSKVLAQLPVSQIGGRALGASGSTITYIDVWSQYHNQAALSNLKGIAVGIGFQNQFLIKELSTKTIAFAFPTKSGVFGFNYYYFGYPKFNESKVGLAFARPIGKKISIGIQLNYNLTHIDGEYGNKGIATGEIGILAEPFKDLLIGAHLFNIWRSKRSSYSDEYLPTIFKIGASYRINKKALLSAEFEKDLDLEPIIKSGLEVELIEKLYFRAGISSNPNLFSFGPGYSFGAFTIDIAFSKHPVLGFSQGISIVYGFKDRL